MDHNDLADHLIRTGILKTPPLRQAFRKVDRIDFVRNDYVDLAYQDHPLPIGFGQSISQPYTVAFMLELLQPQKNQVILDLGSGSSWTTALLAEIVGPKGRVYGVEIIPELLEFGSKNLERYRYKNITLKPAQQRLGLPEFSPFQKILVSAEGQDLPAILTDQLATNGTLVMPINGTITKIDKFSDTYLETQSFPGFAFVPLQ